MSILILSLPLLRALVPSIAYRMHRPLSVLALVAIYIHLPPISLFSRICIYIIIALFSTMLLVESTIFIYQNGAFTYGGWTRASIMRLADDSKLITVYPGRRIHVRPGQYIKLWIPFSSPLTWFHFRKFYVQSWEPGKQSQLQLFEPVVGKFSRCLAARVGHFLRESDLRRAFFTGPHGIQEVYVQYETVLVIASELGILSVMPYIKHICYCVKARTSKARRIHLVWQVPGMTKLQVEQPMKMVLEKEAAIDKKIANLSEQKEVQVELSNATGRAGKLLQTPSKLIQYHLSRYVPEHEREQQCLDIILDAALHTYQDKSGAEPGVNLRVAFQDLKREIGHLENEIEWLHNRMRIMNNILCWVNSKFDDIKEHCVGVSPLEYDCCSPC